VLSNIYDNRMAVLVCPFYLVAYVIQGMLTVCAAVKEYPAVLKDSDVVFLHP